MFSNGYLKSAIKIDSDTFYWIFYDDDKKFKLESINIDDLKNEDLYIPNNDIEFYLKGVSDININDINTKGIKYLIECFDGIIPLYIEIKDTNKLFFGYLEYNNIIDRAVLFIFYNDKNSIAIKNILLDENILRKYKLYIISQKKILNPTIFNSLSFGTNVVVSYLDNNYKFKSVIGVYDGNKIIFENYIEIYNKSRTQCLFQKEYEKLFNDNDLMIYL